MTVKKLISMLKKENPKLEVRVFAHDQNPEDHRDHGVGYVYNVYEVINDNNEKFVVMTT